jgi:hypothetical protein
VPIVLVAEELHELLTIAARLQLVEDLSKLSSLIFARASREAAFLSYKLVEAD